MGEQLNIMDQINENDPIEAAALETLEEKVDHSAEVPDEVFEQEPEVDLSEVVSVKDEDGDKIPLKDPYYDLTFKQQYAVDMGWNSVEDFLDNPDKEAAEPYINDEDKKLMKEEAPTNTEENSDTSETENEETVELEDGADVKASEDIFKDKIVEAKEVSDENEEAPEVENEEEATEEVEDLAEEKDAIHETEDTLDKDGIDKEFSEFIQSLDNDRMADIDFEKLDANQAEFVVSEMERRADVASIQNEVIENVASFQQEEKKAHDDHYTEYNAKADEYFNSLEGKLGFEFDGGSIHININEDAMKTPEQFLMQYADENNRLDPSKAAEISRKLLIAENFDQIVKSAVEHTEARVIREMRAKSRNIDMGGYEANKREHDGSFTSKRGTSIRVVPEDAMSAKQYGFKVKSVS